MMHNVRRLLKDGGRRSMVKTTKDWPLSLSYSNLVWLVAKRKAGASYEPGHAIRVESMEFGDHWLR